MKITVIVPAYNEEKLIFRCLQSLAQQADSPDEVVVVDNACTDATAAIVADFIENYPGLPVKLIHEPIKGHHHARDAGWRAAAGDVIVMVDADEIFPPDWIAKVRAALRENPDFHALGGAIRFENAPPVVWATQVLYNLIYPRLTQLSEGFPYLCGGMTICKREVFEKMDGYRNKPADQLEDYYLSSEAHKLGFKLKYVPHIYALHSIRRYEAAGLIGWLKWGFAAVDSSLYDEDIR
jgi:glycosyltransferase involved in cell wall biosynthesis